MLNKRNKGGKGPLFNYLKILYATKKQSYEYQFSTD